MRGIAPHPYSNDRGPRMDLDKARMLMEFEAIAERDVVCIFSDGHRETIRLRVGKPRPSPSGDWECPVAAEGLYKRLHAIVGVDSWQALKLGLRFLEELLETEVCRGAVELARR